MANNNPPLTYDDQWIEDALRVERAATDHQSCSNAYCRVIADYLAKFSPPTVEGMLLELKRLRAIPDLVQQGCWLSYRKTTNEWIIRNGQWAKGIDGGPLFNVLGQDESLDRAIEQARAALASKQEK